MVLCLSAMFIGVFTLTLAKASPTPKIHVYKNGFVERSFSVVVRDDRVNCEYLIGLNDWTAQALLQAAREEKANRADVENQNDSNDAAVGDSRTADGKDKVKKSTLPLKKNDEPVDEGEHLTDPGTIKELAGLSEFWFSEKLGVTCDDQNVKLQKLSVSADARHPYSIIVRFEFDLMSADAPDNDSADKGAQAEPQKSKAVVGKTAQASDKGSSVPRTVELKIMDEVFPDDDGAIRYALKTKGSAMVARSNVAAILVRAERIELGKLDKVERKQATILSAKIIVSAK